MSALIARDDGQLRRVERGIAQFKGRPAAEQRKMACLLAALHSERAALLRYDARARRTARSNAVAA